jgi:hypothetical protein
MVDGCPGWLGADGEGAAGAPLDGAAGAPLDGRGRAGAPLEGSGSDGAPLDGSGNEGAPDEGRGSDGAPLDGNGSDGAALLDDGAGGAGEGALLEAWDVGAGPMMVSMMVVRMVVICGADGAGCWALAANTSAATHAAASWSLMFVGLLDGVPRRSVGWIFSKSDRLDHASFLDRVAGMWREPLPF